MKASHKIDMTEGPILKLVVLFALPLCVGSILQLLYSTVDTLVIGNFCGTVSLAAVGTSAQPVEMLMGIFLGLGTGVSILVSQYVGCGNMEQLKATVATATSFLYLCAIPLALLGLVLGPAILKLMDVPAETWDLCVSYVSIIFLGSLGNMGYNMNAGILRGLGDSRAPLLFLLISCVMNILLDLLFVAVFGMDVPGAALATALAMFASWFFSIWHIKRHYPELELRLLPGIPNKAILGRIVMIGLPLGLNNSIYSIGHILMQTLVNQQGAIFIAGCSVGGKLNGLANVAVNSFAAAATTFAGQNLGAKNYIRLKQGGLRIPLFSGGLSFIACMLFTLYGLPLLSIFSSDPAVLTIAETYMRITLPFVWMYAVLNGIICFVNGIGIVRYPTIVNILMLWAVRIPSAYLISWFIGGDYIMACYPISFAFGMISMLAFFLTKRWKEIKRFAAEQERTYSPISRM